MRREPIGTSLAVKEPVLERRHTNPVTPLEGRVGVSGCNSRTGRQRLSLADTSKMKGRNDVIVIALILMVITRLMQRSVTAFAPDGERAAGSDPPAGYSSLHRRPKGPVRWHGKTP